MEIFSEEDVWWRDFREATRRLMDSAVGIDEVLDNYMIMCDYLNKQAEKAEERER